ncbi:hypothetical protein GCM10009720_07850 [Yaniella flava]|uniref:Uncharacterized protein n=1 Tax=Yaniella flava TaxID=287930 RepID=A0ABN2U657_9MICC
MDSWLGRIDPDGIRIPNAVGNVRQDHRAVFPGPHSIRITPMRTLLMADGMSGRFLPGVL